MAGVQVSDVRIQVMIMFVTANAWEHRLVLRRGCSVRACVARCSCVHGDVDRPDGDSINVTSLQSISSDQMQCNPFAIRHAACTAYRTDRKNSHNVEYLPRVGTGTDRWVVMRRTRSIGNG